MGSVMVATISGERVADVGTDHAAEAVEEEFWALICSDEELLNAEFEAIIAAERPSPPAPAAGRRAYQHRWGMPAPGRVDALPPAARPAHPGIDGWSRQRSPPHAQ
ncbi:MAG TPA: hypothetical protein VFL99_06855 [Segeticoccus sp.]|uniref:hypothetical protein n=1 Tax=Segeticoccus sp. TaxID=2706531 RepID=UPI002D7FE59F|nr:hypothetical protein [Segeticoccus sp.]HET8600028.1 hypothetical protein [Segeticoccus sp.]